MFCLGFLYLQNIDHSILPDQFVVGDTVTVEDVRQHFNGSQTLTAVKDNYLEFVKAQITTREYHTIAPWGRVYGTTSKDYATLPEVNLASLLIAVDIWQSRQTSNAGGISPDFTPSPYRMGNTLMARVRGLLRRSSKLSHRRESCQFKSILLLFSSILQT